jgi:hypothetical protein
MNKTWSDNAWEDYLYWQTQDRKTLKRINDLLRDIERDPFGGIGKPECERAYSVVGTEPPTISFVTIQCRLKHDAMATAHSKGMQPCCKHATDTTDYNTNGRNALR